jgi:hypothetical protein
MAGLAMRRSTTAFPVLPAPKTTTGMPHQEEFLHNARTIARHTVKAGTLMIQDRAKAIE